MKLFGVTIDEIRREDALLRLEKSQVIFTPNPEILLEARRNRVFQRALSAGTLMLPDGHGLQFVSTLLQVRSVWLRAILYFPALLLFLIWKGPFTKVFPEVIHGSDFMDDVVHFAATRGYSVFFLGGKNSAQGTADYFVKKYPRLKVAGVSSQDPSEEALEAVKQARTQVLFVAYGAPKQELWISKYAKQISGLKHVMAVGGSFDFYSGKVKRSPKVLRAVGLEWLWRLCMNPWQRIRRICNAVVVFPIISFGSSSLERRK